MLYIDPIYVDWTPPLVLKKAASHATKVHGGHSEPSGQRYLKMTVLMMLKCVYI